MIGRAAEFAAAIAAYEWHGWWAALALLVVYTILARLLIAPAFWNLMLALGHEPRAKLARRIDQVERRAAYMRGER